MRGLAEAVLADLTGGPELLVDGPGAHDLAWRDWLDPAVDEVPTPNPAALTAIGVTELLEAAAAAPVSRLTAAGT